MQPKLLMKLSSNEGRACATSAELLERSTALSETPEAFNKFSLLSRSLL